MIPKEQIKVFLDYLRSKRLSKETYEKASKSAIEMIVSGNIGETWRLGSGYPSSMFSWTHSPEGKEFWVNVYDAPLR